MANVNEQNYEVILMCILTNFSCGYASGNVDFL